MASHFGFIFVLAPCRSANISPYHIDELAKRLKVEPPTCFEYEDPEFYGEMFGDDLGPEISGRLKKQKEWHDASVGVKTFAALLKHCRAHADNAMLKNVEAHTLPYELEAFHLILQEAGRKKDSFRIEALV